MPASRGSDKSNGLYAAFLRGINIGGKSIKMDELRKLAADLGYGDVRSYIQTGNLVFSASKKKPAELAGDLSGALRRAYGFDVAVLIRTAPELEAIAAGNPFPEEAGSAVRKLYLTLLEKEPAEAKRAALLEYGNEADRFELHGLTLYTLYGNGYGKSEFSNNFIEKKLGVAATTRNWASFTEILKMMKPEGN